MLTLKEQNLLVENYIPLANKLAHLKAKQLPKRVDIEELKSAAYFGLVDASRHFNPEKSSGFGPYAIYRVYGEINDCIRWLAWGKKTRRIVINNFSEEAPEFLFLSCKGEESVETHDLCEYVMSEIQDDGSRDMVCRYYILGHKLKDIADDYNLSIGRISQILKEIIIDIRQKHETKKAA